MGSFKRDGQNQKPNRRRGINGPRRRGDVLGIESLESRTLLSGWKPTNNNLADAQNGPMANEGQTLVDLYQSFLKTTGSISSLESQTQFDLLQFKGNSVFLDVKVTGTFSTAVTSLKDLGMQVTTTGADTTWWMDGSRSLSFPRSRNFRRRRAWIRITSRYSAPTRESPTTKA